MTYKKLIKKNKNSRILPLKHDKVFTSIFYDESILPILEYFVKDFFVLPIEEVRGNLRLLNVHLLSGNINAQENRVDLLLMYQKMNHKINIEVNMTDKTNRNTAYGCKIVGDNLVVNTKSYNNLTSVSQINFDGFRRNGKILCDTYWLTGEITKEKNKILSLNYLDMAFAEKMKYNGGREGKLKLWCIVMKCKNARKLRRLLTVLGVDKKSIDRFVNNMERFSNENVGLYEEISALEKGLNTQVENAMEEGKREGLKEGKREGLKEGKKEGLKEGLKEGRNEERNNVIENLKSMGMSKEFIEMALDNTGKIKTLANKSL